jgi:hypothetical protein
MLSKIKKITFILNKIKKILLKLYKFIITYKKIFALSMGVLFILVWSYSKTSESRLVIVCANNYHCVSKESFGNFFGRETEIIQHILHNKNVLYEGSEISSIKQKVTSGEYGLGFGFIVNNNDGYIYSIPIMKNVNICEITNQKSWKEGNLVIMPIIYKEHYKTTYSNVRYFKSIDKAINYFKSAKQPVKIIIDGLVYMNCYNELNSHEVFIGNSIDLCLICHNPTVKKFIDDLIGAYDIDINVNDELIKFIANNNINVKSREP